MRCISNRVCIRLNQIVVPSDGRDELSPPSRLAVFFFSVMSFVSVVSFVSPCRSASEPRSVEDSDAFPGNGPGATGGGAGFCSSSITLAESSSQLFFSFASADRTQGTVIAAQIAAHINGTAHPMPYATGLGTGWMQITTVHATATNNPGMDQNQDWSLIIFRKIGLALYLAAHPSRNGLPPPAFTATISSTM